MSATAEAMGAAGLARAIRARELSAREAVDAALARIAAVDPAVNAVRVTLADSARAEADRADARLAAGEPVGPLHGVPVTVKENIDVAGTATTHGVTAFAGAVAPEDAPAAANLRAAGAIVVGRTNMGEMALRWHTASALGPALSDEARRFVDDVLGAVPGPDPARYAHAFAERQAIAREWAALPLVLAPVCSAPPFRAVEDLGRAAELLGRMRAVVAVNLLGLPAVAVHGVQVIGPRLREDLCLDAAGAIEAALGVREAVDPV